MKNVAICLVTFGVVVVPLTQPLRGADIPVPSNKTAAPIIIKNKAESPASARTPYLSAGLPEVVKMHKAGVDASVLLAFVQNSPTAYHPSAKEIIYLRDQGVSSEIISALLRRGGELRDRAAEAAREDRSRASPPPVAPIAQPTPVSSAPPQATAPAPVVVYTNPTYPAYTTPSYVTYSAYSYPWPAYYNYYNYSYCRPYYNRSFCYPSYYSGYRSPWSSAVYAGYRSGCYPAYGNRLSVGYGGGRYYGRTAGSYYGHTGGAYYGRSGGYRSVGGSHGGGGYRRR